MKRISTGICFFLMVTCLPAVRAADNPRIHLIPQPVSVSEHSGEFTLDQKIPLLIDAPGQTLDEPAAWFIKELHSISGIQLQEKKSGKKGIHLKLTSDKNIIGKEGYTLSVTPSSISLSANTPAGIFYGMQTLLQLLPANTIAATGAGVKKLAIPCVEITDYPRFGWRGIMLDVSRHFFTKAEVEKYIDEIVRYKYNVLHLHLSDDQGWRIEIKSLPKLTSVWRLACKTYRQLGRISTRPGK